MASNRVIDALALAKVIEPILHGQDAAVQGAALAHLLAIWIAGHDDLARVGLIEMHMESVRRMVPIIVKERRDAHERQVGESTH